MRRLVLILSALLLLLPYGVDAKKKDFRPSLKAEKVVDFADWTPEDIEVKGSTQGFAMWGRYCVVVHDKGQCCVFDMKKKKLWASYFLEGNESHCNNAFFGKEKASKSSKFPLLYISECRGGHACLVTDLTDEGGKVIQKIYFDNEAGDYPGSMDWARDLSGDFIYTYGGKNGSFKLLKKFKMPSLADSDENGEVHLHESDVLDITRFESEINIWQGSLVDGRYAYLPDGYPPHKEYIHVADLEKKEIIMSKEVTDFGLEPEGLDKKGNWLYVIFHKPKSPRHSTLYRFKLK